MAEGSIDGAARHRPSFLFNSFQGWSSASIGRDAVSGLTLAAITIPEQMATARLGGFEPQVGFYAFIGATLGFAVFGASRVLTAGADSTITPIFAATLATLAAAGSGTLGSSAVALALLVGAMLVVGGVLKLGWIANLLSTPVLTGFLAGISVHILMSQLPGLLGIAGGGRDFFSRVMAIVDQLAGFNPYSTAIGIGVLALMLVGERINPRVPAALIGVVLATACVLIFALESRGVGVLGALPSGLPQMVWPAIDEWRPLLPLALVVTLVIMMQTATVSHSFRNPDGSESDINRDFLGIGVGNLASGLLGAMPVDASPPRTAVVAEAGGASQLGALVAAAIVLILVLWGGTLLTHVPQAALAGVLLFVALRIFRLGAMLTIAKEAPTESLLVLLTMAAIVVLPIETGVAIGIGLSLLHGVWMTTRTAPVELKRLPGTTVWWPSRAGLGESLEGVVVLGFPAPLLFANADTFKRGMIRAIDARDGTPVLVVLEGSGIADIDYTAAQALKAVIGHCRTVGIGFAIARLESVRAQAALGRFGIVTELGEDHLFHSVDEAVRALAPQG